MSYLGKVQYFVFAKNRPDSALFAEEVYVILGSAWKGGKNRLILRQKLRLERVTHIMSMIASPFPEYRGAANDYYFLTSYTPQVCIPEESRIRQRVQLS